jgi:hypothetical protein
MSSKDQIRSHERTRRDRQIDDYVHDPYHSRYKPREPAVCPTCGVVFEHGSWHWKSRPADANEHTCPACQRIHDHMPAGYVTLSGSFFNEHREEIMQLVHHQEERAKAEHPMERIIEVRTEGEETIVQTTDVHLAKRLGDAVHHAYQGELDTKYAPDEYLVRVLWSR